MSVKTSFKRKRSMVPNPNSLGFANMIPSGKDNMPFSDVSFVNKVDSIDLINRLSRDHKMFRDDSSLKKIIRKLRSVHSRRHARFFRKLPNFLEVVYKVKIPRRVILDFINRFERRIVHHGFVEACKQFRALYSFALRFCAEHKNEPLPRFSAKEMFPKILNPFRSIMQGDLTGRASVLVILDLPRLYGSGDEKPDPVTITDPGVLPPDDFTIESNCHPGRFFERLQSNENVDVTALKAFSYGWKHTLRKAFPSSGRANRLEFMKSFSGLHISNKSGPNGTCLVSSPQDYLAMKNTTDQFGNTLLSSVRRMCDITDNKELRNTLDFFEDICNTQINLHGYSDDSFLIGKISIKQESFAKARLIAIVDFFTQSCLKPLHEVQFAWLKRQVEDGTFDQDRPSNIIKSYTNNITSNEDGLFSLDLTAATDRIPIDLQFEIVTQQFGSEIARIWRTLCSDRPFEYRDGMVRYAVGQPMGTYSSWSNLATFNHMVARTAKYVAGCKASRDPSLPLYFVIGDDFACKGLLFARTYKNILTAVGVKISETKGFTPFTSVHYRSSSDSDLLDVPNSAELAKRVFVRGVEVSPLRPIQLFKDFFKPVSFKGLIDKIFERVRPLGAADICKIADLTGKRNKALSHLISMFNPSLFMMDLLKMLPDYSNSSYHDLLLLIDRDFNPIGNTPIGSIIQGYSKSITLDEVSHRVYNIFYKKILLRFQQSLRRVKLFINKQSFKDVSERALNPLLPIEYGQGFLLMFDYLMLYVYKKAQTIFKDVCDLLSQPSFDPNYVRKICTLLMGVREYDLLIKGSRSTVPQKDLVSSIVEELESSIMDDEPVSDDTIYSYMNYEDIESLFTRREKESLDNSKFERFIPTNSKEAEFLSTREGFKSVLSPEVSKTMEWLSAKFGKELITGPSLLKKKVILDEKLNTLIIEGTIFRLNTRNIEYFKVLEDTMNATLIGKTSQDLLHQSIVELTLM